jgi:hypothetical protein
LEQPVPVGKAVKKSRATQRTGSKRHLKICFAVLLLMITCFGCNKEKEQKAPLPVAVTLLTEKPWKLLSYGYDSNKDGLIGVDEESIRDCEKDNVSVFNSDGTGIVQENALICDGNDQSSQFKWSLTNNDTVLDFIYGTAFIAKLSGDNLIITNSNSDLVKLIVIYGH